MQSQNYIQFPNIPPAKAQLIFIFLTLEMYLFLHVSMNNGKQV